MWKTEWSQCWSLRDLFGPHLLIVEGMVRMEKFRMERFWEHVRSFATTHMRRASGVYFSIANKHQMLPCQWLGCRFYRRGHIYYSLARLKSRLLILFREVPLHKSTSYLFSLVARHSPPPKINAKTLPNPDFLPLKILVSLLLWSRNINKINAQQIGKQGRRLGTLSWPRLALT